MLEISRIPYPGETSKETGIVQLALNVQGYKLIPDNIFGRKTLEAVKDYQTKMGLILTGVPDKNTLAALGINLKTDLPIEESPVVAPSKITRLLLAQTIVGIIQKDVTAKLRETHGKNRSPRIDSFNQRTGVPMGSPYCASGAWCAVDDACKHLGLTNPIPPTASSQAFRRPSFVPAKYIRSEGSLGKMGDFGVLQVPGDSSHGHLTVLRYNQPFAPNFPTIEYNTNIAGSRDGDGCYTMFRSTKDLSPVNSGKLFICFTDIPQWVLDSQV